MNFFKKLKAQPKTEHVTSLSPNVSDDIARNRLAIAIELLLVNPLDMKKWLALDLNQEYTSWQTIVIAYLSSKGVNDVDYLAEFAHVLLCLKYTDTMGHSDYQNKAAPPWIWNVENSLIAHKRGTNTDGETTVYKTTTISATTAIHFIEQAEDT